jgi:hypothetical protein
MTQAPLTSEAFSTWVLWDYMIKRIRKGRGNNVLVCGEPGAGKSWRCGRGSEAVDLNGASISKYVRDALEFSYFLDCNKIVKGDAIFWDENIGAEAMNWATSSNKSIKRSANVMRRKNFTLFMALPSIKDLDSKLRHLFHFYIEPIRWDEQKNGYYCLFMRIQHNALQGKTYYKHFRVIDKNTKEIYFVNTAFIKAPSKEWSDAYEIESEKTKDNIHHEDHEDIKKEGKKKLRDWDRAPNIDQDVARVLNEWDNIRGKDKSETIENIGAICDVGERKAIRILAKVRLIRKNSQTNSELKE